MKRLLLVLFLIVPVFTLSAQDIADGYYRVHNKKTDRYVYVRDNTGKIDYVAVTADMTAIELWKGHDKTYSDPGSIIYLKKMGTNDTGTYYDLESQGTSVHKIIKKYYVNIYRSGSYYQLYAEGKYLCDNETSSLDVGVMGLDRKGDYRNWIATAVDSNSDEWFGITPTVSANGRYLHPFFADFGFSFVPDGMKAWYIMTVDKERAVIKEITDKVIPARTPVIIECVSENAQDNKIDLIHSYAAGPSDNNLKGVYFNNRARPKSADARKVYDKTTMRVLGVMSDGRLGYVLSTVKADAKTKKQYLEANQSYLIVGPDIPDEIPLITESEYNDILAAREASVGTVSTNHLYKVYSISGESKGLLDQDQLDLLPSGVYIIDNRKVVK
jgi:hypothetical protein